jgi:hypothetical protein
LEAQKNSGEILRELITTSPAAKLMKSWLLLIVVLTVPVQAGETQEYEIWYKEELKEDFAKEQAWLATAPREMLIDGLVKERQAALVAKNYSAATDAARRLVMLGHAETIQELVETIQRRPYGGNPIEGSPTETTIPYLIPLLFRGSTIPDPVYVSPIRGDVTARDRAALAIMQALRRRLVFPDDTRRWAEKMSRTLLYPMREQRVDLVKQWWEHNKQAIEEGRYSEATWLPPDYKGEPSCLSLEEVNELKAKQTQDLTSRRAANSIDPAAAASSRKAEESTSMSETKRSTGQTIGIILAALFTIVATLVWKLRRAAAKS